MWRWRCKMSNEDDSAIVSPSEFNLIVIVSSRLQQHITSKTNIGICLHRCIYKYVLHFSFFNVCSNHWMIWSIFAGVCVQIFSGPIWRESVIYFELQVNIKKWREHRVRRMICSWYTVFFYSSMDDQLKLLHGRICIPKAVLKHIFVLIFSIN